MDQTIEFAKKDFLRAKARMEKGLATTPDEWLNWAPSSTARTVIQQVAHSALAMNDLNNLLQGIAFAWDNPNDADRAFRERETEFMTREEVLALLEEYSTNYLDWLDALTPERLDDRMKTPFGNHEVPLRLAITFQPFHLNEHASQIDYIQTIYGDQDWHLS
ncbi:MAG TPA: DinB family protein [Fimbriimonadaceae bacterium]|jgi:hypothetical protein